MKSATRIAAALAVLSIALFAIGCGENPAKMDRGSDIRVTDKDGNEYLIIHELGGFFRVRRLP